MYCRLNFIRELGQTLYASDCLRSANNYEHSWHVNWRKQSSGCIWKIIVFIHLLNWYSFPRKFTRTDLTNFWPSAKREAVLTAETLELLWSKQIENKIRSRRKPLAAERLERSLHETVGASRAICRKSDSCIEEGLAGINREIPTWVSDPSFSRKWKI